MAIATPAPSLFSTAPPPIDPTAQFSLASGLNLGALPAGLASSALPAPLVGLGGGITGVSPLGAPYLGGQLISAAPRQGFAGSAQAGGPLPSPMSMGQVNSALAGLNVPSVSVPTINPQTIIGEGSLITADDVSGLAQSIYKGGQALVAPQRAMQLQQLQEQLSQSGILNSPAGIALQRTLQLDQIQQDDALAAQATQTATQMQVQREQLRTNVIAQVQLANQQAQVQAALQTQQLQAEAAATKAGLSVQAITTQFNQQLAVSQLMIQKFFEFGNLMLGMGQLQLGQAALAQQGQAQAASQAQASLALRQPPPTLLGQLTGGAHNVPSRFSFPLNMLSPLPPLNLLSAAAGTNLPPPPAVAFNPAAPFRPASGASFGV